MPLLVAHGAWRSLPKLNAALDTFVGTPKAYAATASPLLDELTSPEDVQNASEAVVNLLVRSSCGVEALAALAVAHEAVMLGYAPPLVDCDAAEHVCDTAAKHLGNEEASRTALEVLVSVSTDRSYSRVFAFHAKAKRRHRGITAHRLAADALGRVLATILEESRKSAAAVRAAERAASKLIHEEEKCKRVAEARHAKRAAAEKKTAALKRKPPPDRHVCFAMLNFLGFELEPDELEALGV
jgi:hypothetical protein